MNAFWRRLDRPGHDAACLRPFADGWRLTAAAVFLHGEGPACLAYCVDVDGAWTTKRGTIRGFVGERAVDHAFAATRAPGAWTASRSGAWSA